MTGLRRYANRRDKNEAEIVAALEKMGCLVERMDKPCDLLVKVGGLVILCEVKNVDLLTKKGKPRKGVFTDEQQDFRAKGWEVWTLRDTQDAVNMVNMVRRQAA